MEIKQRGGQRPGAGRPQGSKNRPLVTLATLAGAIGEDALDVLEQAIKDKSQPMAIRVQSAIAVLDYGQGAMGRSNEDYGTGATRNALIEAEKMFSDV